MECVFRDGAGGVSRGAIDRHRRRLSAGNFPNCPRTTIYEASERDFRIVCVPDALSGTYERGLEELRNIGVATWDTEETLEWLKSM
ncbi:MAG: hypothetical protein U5K37_11920 [Natrialbaceae archaeon]|nr:hypothetical protein [Natrialbaceae archaeon]